MSRLPAVAATGIPGFDVAQMASRPVPAPGIRCDFRNFFIKAQAASLRPRSPVSSRLPPAPDGGSRAWMSSGESPPVRPQISKREDDPLDPLHRRRAALAPSQDLPHPSLYPIIAPAPFSAPAPTDPTPSARAATSLEDLLPALVRRIAWSGDRYRGSVRLELGAGELAGATVWVHAEAGRVRVHMHVPPGVDADGWQQRIRRRLASRGVPTDTVEVT
jgi:hypothetical protein